MPPDHTMSAEQIRRYAAARASCDEYGITWRNLVIDCVNGGFMPGEIAERTGEEVQNVLAALDLPTSLAELDPAAVDQAAQEAAAKRNYRDASNLQRRIGKLA